MEDKKFRALLIGSEDEENLAIRYLGAVLQKEGHKVEIAPCSRYEDFSKVLKSVKVFNPDLIGISLAFQSLANMFFDLIKRIKKINSEAHIVVGGHFPTFEYKKILETQSGIDSVIRFEGEKPIVELVNAIKNNSNFNEVHNLVYRNGDKIIENECIFKFQILDDLLYPLRSEKSQERIGEKFATLVSSRGCWHASCLYCCIGAFHSQKQGEKYTFRTPENVAKEISKLYSEKQVRLFQFHDDNFMMPTKEQTFQRFKILRQELVKNNVDLNKIAFVIKARPDSIDDAIAEELSKLGVIGTFLGIENASESGLKALIRRTSLESIHNALSSLKKYDIIVTYNLLVFHPEATMKEIEDNIKFIRKYPYLPYDVARAEIVAGSPLERLIHNKKSIIGLWPNWGYILDDPIVDRMFEIYLKSFRRKGSLCQKMAQHSIMLAYHAHVLKKLHKGRISLDLSKKSMDLVKSNSLFIADNLEIMKKLALNDASNNEIDEFDKKLYKWCKEKITKINNSDLKVGVFG